MTLSYEYVQVALSDLKKHPKNARTHSKRQIKDLERSLKEFGFAVPVVIDENNTILAGHARVEAAKNQKRTHVPAIRICGLTETKKRAFALADNKIASKAGWDRPALAIELDALAPLLAAEGLDISLTGFDAPEIDQLLGDVLDPEQDPADELPAIEQTATTRPGDVWILGTHRLLCADARERANFARLMAGDRAAMVVSDPPYNVRIASIQGRGTIKHREFLVGSGELSRPAFRAFLKSVHRLAALHSTDGAIHFIFMDWRHAADILAVGAGIYSELKNLIVWVKTNAGQGSFYRSQHELIFAFKNGTGAHRNNFELGQHGRHRSNVWTYAGANTFRAGRIDDLSVHPTVKPVALVADAMRDCSRRGEIVLDPFIGSGTTILAAEKVRRRAYGIEIDPLYVDAAIRRWQAFTRNDATLEATGQTFEEVTAERGHDSADSKCKSRTQRTARRRA